MTVARQITCHSSIEASALVIHATVPLLFRLDVISSLAGQTIEVYLYTVVQAAYWRLMKLSCVTF